MKSTKIIALCAALAVTAFAFDALAKRPIFADIDTNQDGQVSLAEFVEMHAKRMTPEERFARMDTDANGFLSESEMANARGKRKSHERRE